MCRVVLWSSRALLVVPLPQTQECPPPRATLAHWENTPQVPVVGPAVDFGEMLRPWRRGPSHLLPGGASGVTREAPVAGCSGPVPACAERGLSGAPCLSIRAMAPALAVGGSACLIPPLPQPARTCPQGSYLRPGPEAAAGLCPSSTDGHAWARRRSPSRGLADPLQDPGLLAAGG